MLRSLARLAAASVVAAALAAPAAAQYPNRPITLVVPWGAGGGTDATARILASIMEKELKQPVSVVNRTGGNGVVGHSAIAEATADGYTIGLITVEIGMMHWQGLTKLSGASYTPLGLVNADPAGLQVRADSPYKTAKELVDAIKANPGKLKASGTGQGGIWHLSIAGMLKSLNIDPAAAPWVPSNGAAPGLQDLVAGGVDIVPCSIPEARSLIDAGKVKSLAIMDPNPPSLYPNVPPLKNALGTDWSMAAWRGMAAPKGIPKDAEARLVAAVKNAYDSKEYKDFMASRGFGVIYLPPAEFAKFMEKSSNDLGATMKAVGIVKCCASSPPRAPANAGARRRHEGQRRRYRRLPDRARDRDPGPHSGVSAHPGPEVRPGTLPRGSRRRAHRVRAAARAARRARGAPARRPRRLDAQPLARHELPRDLRGARVLHRGRRPARVHPDGDDLPRRPVPQAAGAGPAGDRRRGRRHAGDPHAVLQAPPRAVAVGRPRAGPLVTWTRS
jgi:tripartite-type tricarboxylate transporter receptor subunit TctC